MFKVGIMENVISNALHSRGYPLLAEISGGGEGRGGDNNSETLKLMF